MSDHRELMELAESPLELAFWHHWQTFVGPFQSVDAQAKVGRYRCDSLFVVRGLRIVIELDGKAFHDADRDDSRDADLLEMGIDEVIRVPFAAMNYYPYATMAVLGSWHTEFGYRANHRCCLSGERFFEVMKQAIEEPETWGDHTMTRRQWVESVEYEYEVWTVDNAFGYAQSPKAFLNGWNTTPITRKTK